MAIGDEFGLRYWRLIMMKHDYRGNEAVEADHETIDVDYEIGSVVNGKVIRVIDFGAFILLENDVEGLIHISGVCQTN